MLKAVPRARMLAARGDIWRPSSATRHTETVAAVLEAAGAELRYCGVGEKPGGERGTRGGERGARGGVRAGVGGFIGAAGGGDFGAAAWGKAPE